MAVIELGFAAENMPTDGRGASSAARGTVGTLTACTETTGVCQTGPGSIIAGDTILSDNGYWGVVMVTPSTTTVTVDRWRKVGNVNSRAFRNAGESGFVPPNGNYRCFPANVLAPCSGARLMAASCTGIAAATLLVKCFTLAGVFQTRYSIPVGVAGLAGFNWGPLGLPIDGPFTVTPSVATVLGELVFEPLP